MLKPITLAFLCFTLFPACSFAPANLQSKQSSDLESRRIRRIAVLPPATPAAAPAPNVPFGAVPAPRTSEREAAESLARFVHASLVALPDWQVVSESEVREALMAVPSGTEEARLKRVG